MLRLLLGLLKGVVIGGAVGYGAFAAGLGGGFNWLTFGLVGALVGLLCGRPLWSHARDRASTMWTAILKGVFGFGVGCGLYALASRVWSGPSVALLGVTKQLFDFQFILGGAIGAVYGAFIELDDAPAKIAVDKPGAARR